MKSCPQCKRTYADETLNFCLEDGEWLVEALGSGDTPTAILNSESPTRFQQAELSSPNEPIATFLGRSFSNRMVALALIGILLPAAIGAGGYWYYSGRGGNEIRSIAVLPFENRSGSSDADYLSDGLPDSLIYRLTQLPNLKVSPTSSVMRYKGKEADIAQVAKELSVDAVMSGRLVQIGDSLNISVQLTDARTSKLIWAEQYDRKLSDLLNTQREIAREIVENLKIKVSPDDGALAKHYTESSEAYQLYMKGRFYWQKRNSRSIHKSIEYYQQAIEADPKFALAYSGLADSYALISCPEAGGGGEFPNDVLPKARAAAMKALELDSTLAESHASLGHVLYLYDRDFAGAEREFKKAIELNPRWAIEHNFYAIFLIDLGRPSEALAEIKLAKELDPFSVPISSAMGLILYISGQKEAGLEQLLQARDMDPNFVLTHHRLAFAYADFNRFDDAIAESKEAQRLSEGALGIDALAYTYAKAGKRREAIEQLNWLIDASKKPYVPSSMIARVYGELGEKDEAFKWLEKANDERDRYVLWIKIDPRFSSLHTDPRVADLAKRIGLP